MKTHVQARRQPSTRYRRENDVIYIDIRVRTWRQLFDSRDPAPFRERDLDDDAVAYIVTSYHENRSAPRVELVLHIAEPLDGGMTPAILREAIHAFFAHERFLTIGRRAQSFREGRTALFIGFVFLAFCMIVAQWASSFELGVLALPVREGLTILGWVAMWRPVDILLYSWWPLVGRIADYDKLSAIPIEIRGSESRPAE